MTVASGWQGIPAMVAMNDIQAVVDRTAEVYDLERLVLCNQ